MKHRYIISIIVIFACFSWSGCNIFDRQNQVPTYIHLDSFSFRPPTSLQQVTTSHYINSVYVYYNNNPVGVFDLPCTIPVIATDSVGTLEVEPAIPQDGLNDFELYYPFYTIDTFTFAASPGKIINHTPVTGYYTDVVFPYLQAFEASNGGFALYSGSGTNSQVVGTSSNVFQGVGSGLLSANNDSAEFVAVGAATITPSSASFLELNFKSNTPFAIGLVSQLDGIRIPPYYIGGLNASPNTWQKVYFNLSQYIADYPSDNNLYYLAFKLLPPPGQQNGNVYLDNLEIAGFPPD